MTFGHKSAVEPSPASSGPWAGLPRLCSLAEPVVILSATCFKSLVTDRWLFCRWWVICVTDFMTLTHCLLKDSSGQVEAASFQVRGMASSAPSP